MGRRAAQHYAVVRRRREGGQGLLVPHQAVILDSRNDLPLAELVLRHRGKRVQGHVISSELRYVMRTAAHKVRRMRLRLAKTKFQLD